MYIVLVDSVGANLCEMRHNVQLTIFNSPELVAMNEKEKKKTNKLTN